MFFFLLFKNFLIDLILTVLGLYCCTQAFSTCGKRRLLIAVASLAVKCGLQYSWHMGLAAVRHMESSLTRGQVHVPCIGRQVLSHWTTREVQTLVF